MCRGRIVASLAVSRTDSQSLMTIERHEVEPKVEALVILVFPRGADLDPGFRIVSVRDEENVMGGLGRFRFHFSSQFPCTYSWTYLPITAKATTYCR